MEKDPEWQLLAAWRTGDRQAGSKLLDHCYPRLKRFFANKLDSDADIDDLIQMTLLGCLQSSEQARDDGQFVRYLFAIARNKLCDYLRDRYKWRTGDDIEEIPIEDMAPGQSTIVARKREQRLLLKALRRIPLKYQIVFELHYWEDLPAPAIGAILGLTEPAVRGRLRLAKNGLRDKIMRLAEDPEVLRSTLDNLDRWASDIRARIKAAS